MNIFQSWNERLVAGQRGYILSLIVLASAAGIFGLETFEDSINPWFVKTGKIALGVPGVAALIGMLLNRRRLSQP